MKNFTIKLVFEMAREVVEQAQFQKTEHIALFNALSKPAKPSDELKGVHSVRVILFLINMYNHVDGYLI
ncbi:hypothetical protein J3L16_09655 [Alteromonas sp. 5E99-2]|uniref:hypothetical protein n=1 Tax=Alteromonas sp. 5E99-2 TaxID=2817683 RepID=UPI001A98BC86|nr:hypothetical protein [Alteromonas sp. 5E99-2]MBO1255948.1 hypothetical protein [Alteromonas sp. 5E99-2]